MMYEMNSVSRGMRRFRRFALTSAASKAAELRLSQTKKHGDSLQPQDHYQQRENLYHAFLKGLD